VTISMQQFHPCQPQRLGVSPPSSQHQLHNCRDGQTVSPPAPLWHMVQLVEWDRDLTLSNQIGCGISLRVLDPTGGCEWTFFPHCTTLTTFTSITTTISSARSLSSLFITASMATSYFSLECFIMLGHSEQNILVCCEQNGLQYGKKTCYIYALILPLVIGTQCSLAYFECLVNLLAHSSDKKALV